jgi:hypothetical protein
MGIHRGGGGDSFVRKKILNGADVMPHFKEMRGRGMSERVQAGKV